MAVLNKLKLLLNMFMCKQAFSEIYRYQTYVQFYISTADQFDYFIDMPSYV
jgi:hypothetical protein